MSKVVGLLCRSFKLQPARLATNGIRALSSKAKPFNVFICAVDDAADKAGAALVTALKQISGRRVQLFGVGGRQLADQGLQPVVTQDEFNCLAAAEVIPPAFKLQKGSAAEGVSRTVYAKMFRDNIWEAALEGCRDPHSSSSNSSSSTAGPQQQASSAAAAQAVCFDAVVMVSSSTASQLTLTFLRKAEQMQKAKLPVIVQYMVPGLWDYQTARSAAACWSRLVDHVMCSHHFEPQLLHAAGVPASFVGHPLMQQLLACNTYTRSSPQKARLLSNLLQQQEQSQEDPSVRHAASPVTLQKQMAAEQLSLFASGDAAAFWKCFDAANKGTKSHQQQEVAGAAAGTDQVRHHPSKSVGNGGGSHVQRHASRKRKATTHVEQRQQREELLVALLPGTTESEVISSIPAFDRILQQLQQQQQQQHTLIATLHVPEVLVPAAIQAVENFSLPVLVVMMGEQQAADALAAAAVAMSHPGAASLQAVAAGVPLICVRDGSMFRHVWGYWRSGQVLPYGCLPNLLAGRAAVPEVNLWQRQGLDKAVQAASDLLQAYSKQAAAAAAGKPSGSALDVWQQQRVNLQDVLLRLLPPAQQQQKGWPANCSSSSWQLPGEAAAHTLLHLMNLRQQQDATSAAGGNSRRSSSSGDSGDSIPATSKAYSRYAAGHHPGANRQQWALDAQS